MADDISSTRRPASGPIAALLGAVGVEPEETGSVALMLAHSFAMGLATVLFETAASALFLVRFDAGALPFVYFAAAGASLAVGAAYARARGRLGFGAQMVGTLLLLTAGTLGLRAGIGLTAAAAVPFALMVWYRVLSILTDLEYWAVATRLYDVRQAKRLFGVIGSGEVVARIAGAFSVPVLLAVTAVQNLLVLSAGALLACLAILWVLLRRPDFQSDPADLDRSGTEPARAGRGRSVLNDSYLRLLVSVAFLAVLGKYFVDFAYLAEVGEQVDGTRGLASFLALFSGVSQTLSLATRLFVSRRILGRWGVRGGLLVLPALQLGCTALLLAAGLVPGAGPAVFWLVVANQGVYKTLKHPIDNPSFKILYQTLPRDDRLATQVFVETVVNPSAIAFAGLVMLGFSGASGWSPVLFALPLLVAFGLWTAAARRAGAAYAAAIAASLRGRVRSVSYSFEDRRNLPIIRETLRNGRPSEVLFALELLDRATGDRQRRSRRWPPPTEPGEGHPGVPPAIGVAVLEDLLLDLLSHDSPDVRAAALLRLRARWTPRAGRAVSERLAVERDPRTRGEALRALAASGEEPDLVRVAEFLDAPEPAVRLGALAALLEHGRGQGRLDGLVASSDPVERGRAARVLNEVATGGFDSTLSRLLEDPDPQVCRQAIAAVGLRPDTALWPRVVAAVADPRLATVAARTLASGGPPALEALRAALDGSSPAHRAALLAAAGRMGGVEARTVLLGDLDAPDELIRSAALEALLVTEGTLAGADRERAERQLLAEIDDATWTLEARSRLTPSEEVDPLVHALDGEVERNRQRVLALLALLYDAEAVQRAKRNLAHESRERRARATELLDIVVPAPLKPRVLPLLSDGAEPPAAEGGTAEAVEAIAALLERGPARIGPWALACAALAAARLGAHELAPRLAALKTASDHAIVREVAESSLARLEGGEVGKEAREGRQMNTIERVLTLKSVEMFSFASEEALADVAAILEEVVADRDDVIIRQGDVGDSMYIIIEGRVRVFDEERTFARLGERDIFGELALLDPEPRSASIAAEGETRLFRLDREAFLELLAGNIEIVRGVLQVLCKRLRRSVQTFGAY